MTPSSSPCPWYKRPIFWVFLVGLVLRIGSSAINFHQMKWQNDARMSVPAVRLLEGKGLSLKDGAGPSAYRPPVYILWLSGLYALFGPFAELGPSVAQSLVSAANILLVYLLAKRVWKREDIALASAFLLMMHPYVIYHDAALYHTFLSTALLLSGTLLLIKGYEEQNKLSLSFAGALYGLCILITSVIVPFIGLMIILALFCWPLSYKKRVPLILSFILGLMMTWGPWIIRNAFAFHHFIPLTTESGVTLWMGNNPESAARLPARTHEEASVPKGTAFNIPEQYNGCPPGDWCRDGVSEEQENKELTSLAINWIKQHPSEFIRLTVWRFKGIWSPWLTPAKNFTSSAILNFIVEYGYVLWNLTLVTLAIIGVWLASKKQNWLFPLISLGFALTGTAGYALFLYYTKYRIPFETVLLPLSGAGLVYLYTSLENRFKKASSAS